MSAGDRKPLIVLGCLALLAVGLYVFGAVGAVRGPTAGERPEWADNVSLGGPLTPDDLRVSSGTCSVAGAAITFSGSCALRVVPVEDGWPWSDVTRRARLMAAGSGVNVAVTVQDQPIDTDLDAGDSVRLTFTREGGDLVLTCLAPTNCLVTLVEDTVP